MVGGSAAAEPIAPLSRPSLPEPAENGRDDVNRRELLAYAWIGTLGLLTLGSGLAAWQFIYPRSPANEFGGKFYLGSAANLPPVGGEPQNYPEGRFWLVNTEKGPHAIYILCTHSWEGVRIKLWWDSDESHFYCPACGSRFCPDGDYILGPAPRSLDQFAIELVTGRTVLAMTNPTADFIEAPVAPAPDGEIVVNTGALLQGPPSALTFPHEGISCLNL